MERITAKSFLRVSCGRKKRHWTPDVAQLKSCLLSTDKKALNQRLKRCVFIYKEFGPPVDMLIIGGIPAMFAIHELKAAFINGCDMATVLLAQSFIEHSLGGSFMMMGEECITERGFSELIKNALQNGQINPKLAASLHKLRKLRNPYVHPNSGLSSRTYMGRLLDQRKCEPKKLAERDAKHAIKVVVDFIRSNSQDWNPNSKPE